MAGNENKAGAALLSGGLGGILGYFLAKAQKVAAAPEGIPEELWEAVVAIAAGVDSVDAKLSQILDAISSGTGGGGADSRYFNNLPGITTGQVVVGAAGTAERLPPVDIPDNKALVVKALPGNAALVYVGGTQNDSNNINVGYPLNINELVTLQVQNAQAVWVSGAVGDGIAFIVEQ
jgi:hypothetical protein